MSGMTVYEAREILATTLKFGDPKQIEALRCVSDPKNVTPEQMLAHVEETGEAPL